MTALIAISDDFSYFAERLRENDIYKVKSYLTIYTSNIGQ